MPAPQPRVLVVDDDPTLRAILTRVLEREGLDVAAVGSGAEASDAMAESDVHAVIVDQSLPDTTGTALAARFRDMLGGACPPCLLITASPDTIADEAKALFAAILPKPFSLPELASAVREITERRAPAGDPSGSPPGTE